MMTFIGFVFAKLETAKDVASLMSKKLRFRTHFDSQHVKQSGKLHHNTFITLFHHSVLVISEILGQFVNKFIADDRYSLRNRSFFRN